MHTPRNVRISDPNIWFDQRFPLVADLRKRAKQRIPAFAFGYLDGGCNDEINLRSNTSAFEELRLRPAYLRDYGGANLGTTLFGRTYDAPFGIAPVGLQGLMWPAAPKILAEAAVRHNIPFVLSTVTTESIEDIASLTEGRFWYQLYHPAKQEITNDMIDRLESGGCDVLLVTADVPTFGYRPNEFRSGLAMPPRMTFGNIAQMMVRLQWSLRTLHYGQPRFATMTRYMDRRMSLKQLGAFMKDNFAGRMTIDKLKYLRDQWKGHLVLKGLGSIEDIEKCIDIGLDGVIVSNHGGRQLDAAEPSILAFRKLAPAYADKITMMVDGGIRSGVHVAQAVASGAAFTFAGRAFMYGVAAMGSKGADHTISILKLQLQQVMEQIGCERVEDLPGHLVIR